MSSRSTSPLAWRSVTDQGVRVHVHSGFEAPERVGWLLGGRNIKTLILISRSEEFENTESLTESGTDITE